LANPTLEQPVAKSPVVDKYRSRLRLTYRTNLTGTPAPQTLPFRVFVLGQFEGNTARQAHMLPEPRDREIHSIIRGSLDTKKVDDFIKQMKPWVKIPSNLAAQMPGEVRLFTGDDAKPEAYTLKIGAIDVAKGAEQQVAITGTAHFKSPIESNGVANIAAENLGVSGSMTVVGQDHGFKVKDGTKVTLKFTTGLSIDVPPPQPGAPVGLVTAMLPDLQIDAAAVTAVDDPSSPDGSTQSLKIDGAQKVAAERTLPFASLDDFSPDGVAEHIPELHRLHVIRDLILDLASTLRNNPELRKAMRDGLTTNAPAFKELRTWALQTYKTLVVAPAKATG